MELKVLDSKNKKEKKGYIGNSSPSVELPKFIFVIFVTSMELASSRRAVFYVHDAPLCDHKH
jgi:hypothetical protein